MTNIQILRQVNALCKEHKFDEAIALTDSITNKEAAIKAHMLCIEYELSVRRLKALSDTGAI